MALTAPRDTKEKHPEPYGLGVKANTKIWQGSLCVLDAGYVAPGRAATGLIALGRASATFDNVGGAAGGKTATVEPGVFRWGNSAAADAITAAERGTVCYIVDDQTVAKTDGTGARSAAGVVIDVDTGGVWVYSSLERV